MTAPFETSRFAAAIIDALSTHICVVDRNGKIVAVNRAWRTFGAENAGDPGASDVGAHYLNVCQSASGTGGDEASDFAGGVRAVLEGRSEFFELEYPCHSPTESRWFLGRVTPLDLEPGGAVISHLNITTRKLMEFELARLAGTDPLTGLPNRRYFLDVANREVERACRFGSVAAVVMIDLDHFKIVNDTYGHAAGDEALRRVAWACGRNLRATDVLARWGGEEFVAMFPGTDLQAASTIAEKLRLAVADTQIDTGSRIISVTGSFGVAQIWPSDHAIDEALGRSDGALYEAKRAGRNCVRSSVAILTSPASAGSTVLAEI